jgi:RimJ/RimL family protein N-acetyltransferase
MCAARRRRRRPDRLAPAARAHDLSLVMTARRFHRWYREEIALRDGSRVWLRPVRPDDAPRLAAGFARLSERSRYLRFFAARDRLTADELHYLTHVDGENHFALAAVIRGADGSEEGVGVARFVRLEGEPHVAELAVTVVDAWHRRGIGRLLCQRLVAAARERGIRQFRAQVLPDNAPVLALLHGLALDAETRVETDALVVEIPLRGSLPVRGRVHEKRIEPRPPATLG